MKSALPVTALEVSDESFELHTAPLWPGMWRKIDQGREAGCAPINVPIQSPVQSLSIGLPSLQLEMSRYVPSSWRDENDSWVTGRV